MLQRVRGARHHTRHDQALRAGRPPATAEHHAKRGAGTRHAGTCWCMSALPQGPRCPRQVPAMTDTQTHPDGGSRADGPLSSITDSDREAVRRTEEAPHKCHDILACHDLLAVEAVRLRQQSAELREALEAILNDSEDEFDGQARYRPERIAPARAALARSQQ